MARVPASETTRKRIEAMISGEAEGVDKSELVRAAARLIVEEALEEEVSDALGREFYEHGAKSGIAERLHLGQAREAVLAAWGFTVDGKKVLLGLAPGTKEDTASTRDFLRDLKNRNSCDPLLVSSNGAPGLIRALEEAFPRSLRQRCLAHKMRNPRSEGAAGEMAGAQIGGVKRLYRSQSEAR